MTGWRRRPGGWQVYAKVRGRFISKLYPLDTTPGQLALHRERLIAQARYGLPSQQYAETPDRLFADDARDYLALVTGMPSYSDRAYHIEQWALAFAGRVRAAITAPEIRAVLERWRVTRPLSPGSLNRRRTALMHLYTTLDGQARPNVVKDVPAYDETASYQVRARPLVDCARAIHAVRWSSKTRARLHVMLWTGWPPQLLSQIRPPDIDWATGRVTLAARRKGRGHASDRVPVLPAALRALRHFDRLGAYGPFSRASLRTRLLEGCRRARVAPMHPYQIRHSFGTWLAPRLADDRALALLLRTHSLHRYVQGADDQRLASAVAQATFRPRSRGLRGVPGRATHRQTSRKRSGKRR